MSEPSNGQEPDSGVSPQNLADIKLRLLDNAPNDPDTRLAVEELARMGADAAPLIPLLLEMYRNDRMPYLASETAVGLYASTRSDEFLNAWKKQGGVCNVLDNCRLLELGVADVEDGLLQYLWERWEKAELFNFREDIVTTLGQHGSPKSLEMLKVIHDKLEGKLAELRAALPDDWDENPAFETILHDLFLKNIREAVQSLGQRFSSADRAIHQASDRAPGTTVRASQTVASKTPPIGHDDDQMGTETQDDKPIPTPSIPFGEYDLLAQVTKGGMAEAFVARNRTSGQRVFLKRVKLLSGDEAATIRREADIYAKLMRNSLSGVLKVEDFGHCDEYCFLVTEYANGGDLDEYLNAVPGRQLQPSEAKAIGLEIVKALCDMHAIPEPIVHRDLKPGNILRVNSAWKIGDFGIAKNLARLITQHTFQQAGTSGYAPQEQLEGVEAHPSADVYAFGKILVFFLSGQTDVDRIHRLPRWRDLIRQCFDQDRDRRPNAANVLSELQSMLV